MWYFCSFNLRSSANSECGVIMAVVQIRNAAGAKGDREEMPKRDLISKRAMLRIVENKDKQYQDMRRQYEQRIINKVSENSYLRNNEKVALMLLKKQERLTYYVGVVTFLVGGGLGWLIP